MRLVPALAVALLLPLSLTAQEVDPNSREGIALRNQLLEQQHQQQMEEQAQQPQAAPGETAPADTGAAGMGAYGGAEAQPGGGSGNLTADLLERVSRLEDQTRRLEGRVEELSNQLQEQNATLGKQIGDLNFRLTGGTGAASAPAGEAAAGGAPTAAVPSAPGTGPGTAPGTYSGAAEGAAAPAIPRAAAAVPHRTAERTLQEGNAALARRDYPAAEAAAREVLGGGHTTPRLADAQFLLAQAEAGQHQYQQAAVDYYQAYAHAPHSGRAPFALLGVANALLGIGDRKDACEALGKLHAEFPSPRPEIGRAAAALRARGGCG